MEDDAPVIYGLEFQVGVEEAEGRCPPVPDPPLRACVLTLIPRILGFAGRVWGEGTRSECGRVRPRAGLDRRG